MAELQVGDLVQLKSGGPKMTVVSTKEPTHHNQLRCQWFAGAKLEFGYFPVGALMPVQEEKKKDE